MQVYLSKLSAKRHMMDVHISDQHNPADDLIWDQMEQDITSGRFYGGGLSPCDAFLSRP